MFNLRKCVFEFLGDEQGGGTIMGLLWFITLVGICGLAVDSTDAFRNETILQATADASALAAAIDLPIVATADNTAAVATAIAYSQANMVQTINGNVLEGADIVVGQWNPGTRIVTPTVGYPDAVQVTTRRSDENNNPVPANFLRILSLTGIDFNRWNVQAVAVAQRYVPECLNDGLIARGPVEISSNNEFLRNICVHSQDHVKVQQNNYWEAGVSVSMPDADNLQIPDDDFSQNPGLPEALHDYIFDPRMVDHVPDIIATLIDPTLDAIDERTDIIPAFITNTTVVPISRNFDFATLAVASIDDDGPGKIYHVICTGNQKITIPKDVILTDMVIVSDCRIEVGTNAILSDVVLAAAGGNGQLQGANIHLASGVQLGKDDGCVDGGGVQMYTTQSITNAANLAIYGLQVVAQGNVHIAAQADGINGISVQAGGQIQVTSNNGFGLCAGGAPNLFTVDYYRLVR